MNAEANPAAKQKAELLKLLLKKKGIQHGGGETIPRRPEAASAPLSFAQTRLWFLSQLEGGNNSYNIPCMLNLSGTLDLACLQQALEAILRRHEALRTRFVTVDGEPVQVVDAAAVLSFVRLDMDALPENERMDAAKREADEASGQPFDLANGPLLRCHLWRANAQSHLLLINMHHIVSDGWSIARFTKELAALYGAFLHGQPDPLPALPIQYPDFAAWQRQWLAGERLQTQLDYWKNQLAGLPPLLELPTDRPRPPQQSFRGAVLEFQFDELASRRCRDLARETGTSLFMTMLAGFVVLLARYSGQRDLCIGTLIANRARPELDSLIGFFVNSLALRFPLAEGLSFHDLVLQARDVALGGQAHQDVPFEQVVDALHPQRGLSHSPLFQVLFDFQVPAEMQFALAGLQVSHFLPGFAPAKFDLSLIIEDRGDYLAGWMEFNTDLFDPATIQRLSKNYRVLMNSACADPGQCIDTLPLMDAEERAQMLIAWNQTQMAVQGGVCVHELFESQARLSPDAVAVTWEGQVCRYAELNALANRLAHHLRRLGVGPGILVGLCLERSLETLVSLLAVFKAGGAYLPLDPAYPAERLAYMLADAQPNVLISRASFAAALPDWAGKLLCLDTEAEAIAARPAENLSGGARPDDLAYVLYTSGSTGNPKGVMIPQRALLNHNLAMIAAYDLTAQDKVLQFASFSFDVALEEIFPALLSGATLVMRPANLFASFHDFSDFLRREALTVLNLPAAYWQEWAAEVFHGRAQVPETVRLVVTGSDQVCPEHWSNWRQWLGERVVLINAYGPTEATITATLYSSQHDSSARHLHSTPIGKPLANTQIYLLDEHLQPVPVGVRGELHIAGFGLADGYLNQPQATADKFISNPFQQDFGSAKLYKTGDLARYLADGNLEFAGRIDNQVKIRGFRIELGEIETLLAEHPIVRAAAVVVREDPTGNKLLAAYFSVQGHAPAQEELRAYLRQMVPDYMVPACFMQMDELPMNANGKIDRRALPPPLFAQAAAGYAAPSTPTEQTVAAAWRECLGLERIGNADNFFDLGGHSLRVPQVMSKLRRSFPLDLPLRLLFEQPTVAGLAATIDELLRHGAIQPSARVDLPAEAALDPAIKPAPGKFAFPHSPKRILLTGATGFLGVHLLAELLEQTRADIYCLVRCADEAQGHAKLRAKLEQHRLWQDGHAERIVPLPGDLAKSLLGLAPGEFLKLAELIEVIFHNGASINTVYPYAALKPANVGGTHEILRLACQGPLKPVHYSSTTSVFADPAYAPIGFVLESDPLAHWEGIDNGYIQTKWVAEKSLELARQRGIPVTVHRLARVAGDSRNGICNPDDLFCRLIKGCIQLGAAPDFGGYCDNLTPADHLSRAMVYLALSPQSLGKAFHWHNPAPLKLDDVFRWVQEHGYRLEILPYPVWLERLENAGEDNALKAMAAVFAKASADAGEELPGLNLCRRQVEEGLARADLGFQPVAQATVDSYLRYLVESAYLPNPAGGLA